MNINDVSTSKDNIGSLNVGSGDVMKIGSSLNTNNTMDFLKKDAVLSDSFQKTAEKIIKNQISDLPEGLKPFKDIVTDGSRLNAILQQQSLLQNVQGLTQGMNVVNMNQR